MAFLDDPAFPDFQRLAFRRHRYAKAFTARITQCARPVVDRDRGGDHVNELSFICCRHQNKARQASKIGDVECTGMSWSVGTDETGAIDRKADRQALNRDVVHDLIIRALEERGINRSERLEAFGSEAAGESYRVLFGDADVERAVGKFLCEQVDAGAGRHSRRDRYDLVVLARLLDQALAETPWYTAARSDFDLACAPVATSNLTTP